MIFDTTKMTFEGYHSVNDALTGGLLVVNRSGNKVFLTWASTTAANIGSGILIKYLFKANAGILTTLTWDTQTAGACEYSDAAGIVITSFYNNSNISVVANALIVNAGSDIYTTTPPVQLNGSATGGALPYTWSWSPTTWLSNPAIPDPIASPPALPVIYTLMVTDNNGCMGSDFMQILPSIEKSLFLTVFLEGLYAGGGAMNQAYDDLGPHFGPGIADKVTVELHNNATYSNIEYTSGPVNLSTAGNITISSIPASLSGSYYITIKHRNSIETTTASPVSFAGSTVTHTTSPPMQRRHMGIT